MSASDSPALVALNDHRLESLIRAPECEVDHEIERLVIEAQARIASICGQHIRSRSIPAPEDADDITATVNLRLIAKFHTLRMAAAGDVIRDLDGYVTTVTCNAINDHFRRTSPVRARLKNRLRYSLRHDSRLALWSRDETFIGGLARWRGTADATDEVPDAAGLSREVLESDPLGDCLVRVFSRCGKPVVFDALVTFFARSWIADDGSVPDWELTETIQAPGEVDPIESREYLQALWSEIRQLRPMQRKALLLNLRSADASDVAALFVLTRTCTFAELAAVLEIHPSQLAGLWNDLPLDDLRIAEMLGITRQQVINLRKSARERLHRRMTG